MKWQEAKIIIKNNIRVGTDLNTAKSHFRFVEAINEQELSISIGKANCISISWEILEKCYQAVISYGYDGIYFRKFYPIKASNHPCYVHVIGQIFIAAGLALIVNGKYVQKR